MPTNESSTGVQHFLLIQATSFTLPLADQSVHCCITSPPYYGLRAYAGVEPACFPGGAYAPVPGTPPLVIPGPTPEAMAACPHTWMTERATCLHCGCWRGMHGNEETPHRYLWHCLLWLREIKRVLRDDGVCWVVIGDAFSSGDRQGHGTRVGYKQQTNRGMNGTADPPRVPQPQGIHPGALLGMPGRLHQAALADGWIVRNDVVWAKTAPMPESVRGWAWRQTCGDDPGQIPEESLRIGSWRHTRAHETVLMLCKQMGYWANGEAVREDAVMTPQRRTTGHSLCTYDPPGRQAPSRGDRGVKEVPGVDGPGGRNPRSVVIPRSTTPGLPHYATYPPPLIEPLIRATCPERTCPQCGQGWAPTVGESQTQPDLSQRKTAHYNTAERYGAKNGGNGGFDKLAARMREGRHGTTVSGLRPTCTHYCACGPLAPAPGLLVLPTTPCPQCDKLQHANWRSGLVLDPFVGSGTTMEVARALGRRSVGVDVSSTYLQTIARERLGLAALAAWEGRNGTGESDTWSDLPLFLETTP